MYTIQTLDLTNRYIVEGEMDDFILRSYRSVTDDLLLLYDAYMISKNGRRGVRSASDYLDVVKMLIHEEGECCDYSLCVPCY